MKIVGGNLRLVFGSNTIQALIQFMREGICDLNVSDFGAKLSRYFIALKGILHHRLFACDSFSPFTMVHTISYLSLWVESEANRFLLGRPGEANAVIVIHAADWLVDVFGLNVLAGSVHGFHARIAWISGSQYRPINIGEHHFEFVDWVPGLKMIPRPSSNTAPWHWIPKRPIIPGVSALYCDGNTLSVLQMRVDDKHNPVSLDSVHDYLLARRSEHYLCHTGRHVG
jgi:hypothetical protein